MWNELAYAFDLVATWQNALAIGAGIWAGVIIGAIPGMTGTMAVTLALPFTFYLSPVTSLLLLVALYKGSTYGGSISAILIKTPGTASAACTVLDGYPLAKNGKGGKALNMALASSCIGDFISNMSLFFLAIPLAAFALQIGPPEYFMLMTFSLVIVASISGPSLVLGVVSACLGLLLATVGEDIYGSYRFAMSENMEGGLGVVPVLIGLFALPELIKMIVFRQPENTQAMKLGDNRLSFEEFRGSIKSIVRGSFIGVFMGAIPGVGPSTAAFFSYSEARRTSKNGDNFGKGELEGIAASESANNGCCGATMIPLLALGVPGDVITGVMLGAFMIHGLTPGPLLFQNNIGDVYALFMGMLFSSALLFVAGRLTAGGFAKISKIPREVLLPCVLALCLFGIFSIATNPFDITVLLIMGLVGFVMMVLGIPAAPFLIAFIIGPMFEDNMRRSLAISRGELSIFFDSWISLGFLAMTIFFTILTIRRELLKRKARKRIQTN
ncbi:tripartite tricarboxylate transporter permease [Terasakiella pusilla]|jgi:putative tricarboxylic transport membrane protein|uniref:tripartite tricarboxylate transporter permease n=1 Tax=Terasakiella pusilla TaxID=64973 RepID=UPI000491AA45|nr:tripartite tricarboxylate transporter permease [Terasakiella pusilla]